jgi:YD repeat-containing protein
MKQPRWFGTALAAIVVAGGLLFACGDDGGDADDFSKLEPGGSTISGDLASANTNGDTSLAGFTVRAESDRAVTATTDAAGGFTLSDAPTGTVLVTFTREACSSSFVLGNVISRSSLTLGGITVACGSATVGSITETFRATIHDDPPSPAIPINACVRVGDDNQFRDIDASTASVTDEDGSATTFERFAEENLIEATGTRPAVGEAGVLDATAIRIVEGDVLDPCSRDGLPPT